MSSEFGRLTSWQDRNDRLDSEFPLFDTQCTMPVGSCQASLEAGHMLLCTAGHRTSDQLFPLSTSHQRTYLYNDARVIDLFLIRHRG
jgi:hypothetical protein